MNRLVRNGDESIRDFIERVVDVRYRENDQIIADFGNGIVIDAEEYYSEDKEKMAAALEKDYLDYSNVISHTSALSDSDVILEQEDVNDLIFEDGEFAEDEFLENLPGEVIVSEEELTSSISDDDEIVDGIIETESDYVSNVNDSKRSRKWDLLVRSIVNDIFREEEEIEVEEDFNFVSVTSLESLDLLTRYAVNAGDFEKINIDALTDIDEKIEKARKDYDVLFKAKLEETKDKEVRKEEAVKLAVSTMNSENEQTDKDIAKLISEKEEYNKIMAEYKNKQDSFLTSKEELKERLVSLGHNDIDSDFVDSLFGEEELTNDEKNKLVVAFMDQVVREEMLKVYKLKSALEEYKNDKVNIYEDDFLESKDEEIADLENSKKTIEDVRTQINEYLLEEYPGSKIDENGKFTYDLQQDDPELNEIRGIIEELENAREFIKNGGNHPEFVRDDILNMMTENRSKEEISERLNVLLSYVNTNIIKDSLDSDRDELMDLDFEINDIKQKISQKEQMYNERKYINQDLIEFDISRLDRFKKQSASLERQIEDCDKAIAVENERANIKVIVKKIYSYENFKAKEVNARNKYVALNGNNPDDKQIARFNDTIDFYDQIIENLTDNRRKIVENIKSVESVMSIRKAKRTKEKLLAKKENNDRILHNIEKEIEEKRENNGYEDIAVKNKIEQEIETLKDDLNELEDLKIALSNHTVEQLTNNILNYQNIDEYRMNLNYENDNSGIDTNLTEIDDEFSENLDDDLEEVVDFVSLPDMILNKIKSIPFMKTAVKAIASIVTAATIVVGGVKLVNNLNEKVNEEKTKITVETENEVAIMPDIATFIDAKPEVTVTDEKQSLEDEIVRSTVEELAFRNVEKNLEGIKEENATKLEKEEKEEINKVDTSRIANNMYDAAKGNFIPEEQIYKPSYENQDVLEFIDLTVDGVPVQQILNSGIPIGYQPVDGGEEIDTGKTR